MTDRGPGRRIVVVSGVGVHSDPWHALPATSAAIADVVAPEGEVTVATTDDVGQWPAADLLILNVSGDLAAPPTRSEVLVDAIVAHHERGRPLLALHSSSLAFRDDPRWSAILGGRWVPGVTMHPQIGNALVQATPAADLPADAVPFDRDFLLYDERYTRLETAPGSVVLATHTEDGQRHALAWWRSADAGRGAVVYDALGHGVEAYESGDHRGWLRMAVGALLQPRSSQRGTE